MKKVEKVVIPVAGVGTRLLPVTKSQPKEMLPVGRKPVVQYVVEEAEEGGIRQILFVTGRQKHSIEDHFDHDPDLARRLAESARETLTDSLAYEEELDVSFYYVRQSVQAGLADAVRCARDFVGESHFVVSLGDSIIRSSGENNLLSRMIDVHVDNEAGATIAVEEVAADEVHQYGIVDPDGEGEVFPIKGLVEKPKPSEAPSRLAIAARYIFDPVIFDCIERTVAEPGGELQLTDSIRVLLNMGRLVQCVMLGPEERRYDIGNFASYFRAFVDFALEDDKYGYMLRQHLAHKWRG